MIPSLRPHRMCALGLSALVASALTAACIAPAGAVPTMMNYQGYLTDNSNNPVNGALPMTFRLYAAETGGSALWTESYASVTVTAGVFNAVLGGTTPLPLNAFTGATLWLQTTVNSVDVLPRRPLVTVAYAFRSAVADFAASGGADLWTASGPDIYRASGNVGIGTTSPGYKLEMTTSQADATLAYFHTEGTSGNNYAVDGQALGVGAARNVGGYFAAHNATDNIAILVPQGGGKVGIGTYPRFALEVNSLTPGQAAYFRSDAASGTNYGVDAEADGAGATTNVGGYFQAGGATNNYAVIVPPGGGNVGIGTTLPQYPFDVRVDNTGYASYFYNNNSSGNAVLATAAAFALTGYGDKAGVAGVSYSSTGSGTSGFSPDGVGIRGTTDHGLAGEFFGDVDIGGTLAKTAGSFKIDHPLDPANKYLSHSFVESPDMKNIYDGVITTDAGGFATVELPNYFEALNRDFRYQLTVLGDFAQAIISREIEGNRFTIRTDKPNVKVSWQVTGIRQDAYAKAHPIVVEEDKKAADRGKFRHPELFGRPREEAIGFVRAPEGPPR